MEKVATLLLEQYPLAFCVYDGLSHHLPL